MKALFPNKLGKDVNFEVPIVVRDNGENGPPLEIRALLVEGEMYQLVLVGIQEGRAYYKIKEWRVGGTERRISRKHKRKEAA